MTPLKKYDIFYKKYNLVRRKIKMSRPNIKGIKIIKSDKVKEKLKCALILAMSVGIGGISAELYIQYNGTTQECEEARNNHDNQLLVEQILKMQGQERVDAIKEAYRNAIKKNPNIDRKHKNVVIRSFYPTIERFGLSPQMDREALLKMLAEAETFIFLEKPEELRANVGGDFAPSFNRIRVYDHRDERNNRHEIGHAISKLFDTPGLKEASNTSFTVDDSYDAIRKQFESLSFLIGFDNALDLYLHGDENRLIEMFSQHTNQAKDFIKMMEEWRIEYTKVPKDKEEQEASELKRQALDNRMSEIIKDAIKTAYGEEMEFSLSKVLKDYSAAGTALDDLDEWPGQRSLIDNFYRRSKNTFRQAVNYCRKKRSYELFRGGR